MVFIMILAWRDSIHRAESFSPESLVIVGIRTLEMRQNFDCKLRDYECIFAIVMTLEKLPVIFVNNFFYLTKESFQEIFFLSDKVKFPRVCVSYGSVRSQQSLHSSEHLFGGVSFKPLFYS